MNNNDCSITNIGKNRNVALTTPLPLFYHHMAVINDHQSMIECHNNKWVTDDDGGGDD